MALSTQTAVSCYGSSNYIGCISKKNKLQNNTIQYKYDIILTVFSVVFVEVSSTRWRFHQRSLSSQSLNKYQQLNQNKYGINNNKIKCKALNILKRNPG